MLISLIKRNSTRGYDKGSPIEVNPRQSKISVAGPALMIGPEAAFTSSAESPAVRAVFIPVFSAWCVRLASWSGGLRDRHRDRLLSQWAGFNSREQAISARQQ